MCRPCREKAFASICVATNSQCARHNVWALHLPLADTGKSTRNARINANLHTTHRLLAELLPQFLPLARFGSRWRPTACRSLNPLSHGCLCSLRDDAILEAQMSRAWVARWGSVRRGRCPGNKDEVARADMNYVRPLAPAINVCAAAKPATAAVAWRLAMAGAARDVCRVRASLHQGGPL